MGFSTMNIDSKNKQVFSSTGNDGGSSVPSGFILKLYQMVNGAPDEVISVSASTLIQIFDDANESDVNGKGRSGLRIGPSTSCMLLEMNELYMESRSMPLLT